MRKVLSILALLFAMGVFAQSGRPEAYCELSGLNVKVKTCKAQPNGDVLITFLLENISNNNTIFGFYLDGAVYDDEGNCYENNNDFTYPLRIAKGNGNYEVSNLRFDNFPKRVPTKFVLMVKGVDPAASMFSLVKVRMGFTEYLVMKNIPITRDGD